MPIIARESAVESALAGLPESAAADVRGALEWTAGFTEVDAELELSRHGLQRFLWYALPRKWLIPLADQLAIADSLAAFLDGLEDGGRAHESAGRACFDDPTALAEVAARELIGANFSAAIAEPVLASLLLRDEADPVELTAEAHPIVVEQGWSQAGGPIVVAGLIDEVHRVIRRGAGL